MKQTLLRDAVQLELQRQPQKRILVLTIEGKKYFIKRRMSNGRNRFAKQNASSAFWCEAYKILTVRQFADFAPSIVLMDDDYFVMEDSGKTLQGVAKEAPWQDTRMQAFQNAGRCLAELHSLGLHHGRPALRDIAYDKETDKITLLDWENEKAFVSLDTKALDIFLFIHSCFREKWAAKDTALIDAAMKGYMSRPESANQLHELRHFMRQHNTLFRIIHSLSRFGWVDITAVDNAKAYIDTLTL